MFISSEVFRSPLSPLMAGPGETCWQAIELPLQQIWFVMAGVEVECEGENEWPVSTTILLPSFVQVESFLRAKSSTDFLMESLSAVTPVDANGTKHWAMELLANVWSAKEPSDPSHKVAVFETVSGRRFSNSCLQTPVEDLIIGELILPLATISN